MHKEKRSVARTEDRILNLSSRDGHQKNRGKNHLHGKFNPFIRVPDNASSTFAPLKGGNTVMRVTTDQKLRYGLNFISQSLPGYEISQP
ncbi:hypothetical protein RRG08_028289 [Elysia crispata]|uniref:Uncharacterized protein n=1 Tax=Elysia crispata TaxID=231223 RepID=A0AAE1AY91_9GAST|nr:hypothetical protein RRG08_028289 [Elysia crispata]